MQNTLEASPTLAGGAADHVVRAIQAAGGAIPFERFMALALYTPDVGFYEQRGRGPGKRADFATSVSIGPLFGELLAWRFAQWFSVVDGPVQVIEAGAHDGRLAKDIVGAWTRWHPDLLRRVEYWMVEPSERRRGWQRDALATAEVPVRWFRDLDEMAAARPRGALFGNELLDAFPVRRWAWDRLNSRWLLWMVAANGPGLGWTKAAPESVGIGASGPGNIPEGLCACLPDGFTVDESPSALEWWRNAAEALSEGWLLAIDYALSGVDRFHPSRANGSLRACRRHRWEADPLVDPGDLDLTAPVDFDAVALEGEAAGWTTQRLLSQDRWLTATVQDRESAVQPRPDWTPTRTRQLQALTHPDHLGRKFKVFTQTRARALKA